MIRLSPQIVFLSLKKDQKRRNILSTEPDAWNKNNLKVKNVEGFEIKRS